MRKQKIQWTADEKIRWLGELARAIDEAQQVVWRLSVLRGDNPHTSEIYGRLEAARDEVERLQRTANRQARLNLSHGWNEILGGAATCAAALD